MAITITWADDTSRTWKWACAIKPAAHPRAPYVLVDEKGDTVALVPDFDVKYIDAHQG